MKFICGVLAATIRSLSLSLSLIVWRLEQFKCMVVEQIPALPLLYKYVFRGRIYIAFRYKTFVWPYIKCISENDGELLGECNPTSSSACLHSWLHLSHRMQFIWTHAVYMCVMSVLHLTPLILMPSHTHTGAVENTNTTLAASITCLSPSHFWVSH